jgi:ring-1,2-phenylacetyl-CoA epoxidase subunit PaaD
MMTQAAPETARIWEWLEAVCDPEIPVLSVVDLGIVRAVAWEPSAQGPTLRVTITQTYTGCPAMTVIARDIERTLRERGIARLQLDVTLAPPWTTDWLSAAGREKLSRYGIAPPAAGPAHVTCPRCASQDVELTSQFGSTPCKALYRCNACREPFDYFKCH